MTSLLFVHGAPGDARIWTPVIDRIAPGRDARAITLSFFGQRSMPERGGEFGTERHAQDVIDFVGASFDHPIDIVAWSFGVHPVLLAAMRRPELFGSFLFYEPGLPTYVDDPEAMAAFDADAPLAFGPIFTALQEQGVEAAIRALIDGSGGAGFFDGLPADRREIYLDSAGMMPLLMGGGQPPAAITARDLSSFELPVTIAMGAETRPIFAIPSQALACALPKGKLVTIAGADHMLPETDPARFATIVERWLAKEAT